MEKKENIVTKISKNLNWIRILSKNILEQQKEYNWRINILKSKSKKIMIGIAQIIPETLNKEFYYFIKSTPNYNNVLKKKSLMFYFKKKIDDLIFNYG